MSVANSMKLQVRKPHPSSPQQKLCAAKKLCTKKRKLRPTPADATHSYFQYEITNQTATMAKQIEIISEPLETKTEEDLTLTDPGKTYKTIKEGEEVVKPSEDALIPEKRPKLSAETVEDPLIPEKKPKLSAETVENTKAEEKLPDYVSQTQVENPNIRGKPKPPTYHQAMLTKYRDDLWEKLSNCKSVRKPKSRESLRPRLSRAQRRNRRLAKMNGNQRALYTITEEAEEEEET